MTRLRWPVAGPICGIAFIPLLVVGFGLAAGDLDSSTDPLSKFVSYYRDSGNRAHILVGMYLLVLAAIAFCGFVTGLAVQVRAAGASATPLVAAGVLFAGFLALSAALMGSVAGNLSFHSENPFPSGDIIRDLPQLAFPVLLIPGALSAGAFAFLSSMAGLQTSLFPRWLGALGILAVVGSLAAAAFFPFILFVLWVLVASITMLVRHAAPAARAVPRPA